MSSKPVWERVVDVAAWSFIAFGVGWFVYETGYSNGSSNIRDNQKLRPAHEMLADGCTPVPFFDTWFADDIDPRNIIRFPEVWDCPGDHTWILGGMFTNYQSEPAATLYLNAGGPSQVTLVLSSDE